ncbi:PAS domain-containing protein [Teichococcus vastitatis]|uniref:histidine kinase n=1 Tax=Teichococcus vastitatis TaxID=2307076 RepID=A0ABS9W6S5_9PROT|nr:PAS domain-containing protein [Pseudoroseomonas vastitatis]
MALALSAAVPALGVGGVAAWQAVESSRRIFQQRLQDSARGLALAVDAQIETHLTTLAALAASPLLDAGPASDLSAFYGHAQRVAAAVHAPVVVLGPDLMPLLSTERPYGASLPRTSAVDAARSAFETGRPAVSDLLVTALARRRAAIVVVPVVRGGHTVLAVLTRLEPDALAGVLSEHVTGSDDMAALLTDADHQVVARSSDQARLPSATAVEETVSAVQMLRRAPGWAVRILAPAAASRASWLRPLMSLGLGGSLALLAAALGAAAFGRRIIVPVNALTLQAGDVIKGRSTHRAVVPSTVLEFEVLGRSIADADTILRARTETLMASEQRHRALAEAGTAAIWQAQHDGSIIESRGWEILTGQTPAELVGNGWLKALHPDDAPAIAAQWADQLACVHPIDVECRVRVRSDSYRWHRMRGIPIVDNSGAAAEWIGVVEDVHDRRRVEDSLRENEVRLLDLMATLELASVMVRSFDGTILFWSAGCEHLYGWTAAEAMGRRTHNLLGTIYPVPLAEIEAVLERDGMWCGELRHRTRDGREVIVAVRKVLRPVAGGRPAQVMESVADVTALRHAEEALRASEARFTRAVEAARIATWEWDPVEDAMTSAGDRKERLLGRPGGALSNLAAVLALVHPEDRSRIQQAVQRVMAGETDTYDAEFRVIWPDGTLHWLHSVGRAVRHENGAVRQVSGVSMDVTEQVEARQRRDLLAREVDHRAKNALAVVQSLLRLTPISEPEAFVAAVEARVSALARAHSLLAEAGWLGADLRRVAERELAPYAVGSTDGGAVRLEGPAVPLAPTAVQPLAMLLHELATNAAKHGALSRPGGHVEVRWRAGRRAGEDGLLHLRWSEVGGPGAVAIPVRRGLGSRVIETTIRGQLGGSIERRWDPAGLVCEIRVPLERIMADSDRWQQEEHAA